VDAVLGVGKAGHADHHHVGVIVEPGVLGLRMDTLVEVGKHLDEARLAVGMRARCHDGIDNVAAGAPDGGRCSTHVRRPRPRALLAPLA
jgi:hypothetical protein